MFYDEKPFDKKVYEALEAYKTIISNIENEGQEMNEKLILLLDDDIKGAFNLMIQGIK